jgi:predicted transcriptional regulator
VAILQEAKIILITTQQGKKRHVKMCSRLLSRLIVNCFENRAAIPPPNICHVVEMPVGHFVEANVHAPCGLFIQHEDGLSGHIAAAEQPCEFFTTERFHAELLWFDHGSISYNFINKVYNQSISCLELSFECCSEISYHRNDWPSDISVKINDVDILTFLSPGDFGGRRGKFTPEKWFINNTQYGLLYTIKIDKSGTYLNNTFISSKNISDLSICDKPHVKVSFSVSDSSIHCGGINLFGKNFGDYEQAIVLKLYS